MATVVLSAAGAAVGSAVGGAVMGISATAIGRFAGAALGRAIDDNLFNSRSGAGAQATRGHIDALRLTGTGEGRAIAQVFGRMKLGGHIIWASEMRQSEVELPKSGGGTERHFDYRVDLAIALCEGQIAQVARLWADEIELNETNTTISIYNGSTDQLPDPTLQAALGADSVPAFRGTAYVVLQDFSLLPFGNRLPQFSFEVSRPEFSGVENNNCINNDLKAVAVMPGTGEYALATSKIHLWDNIIGGGAANVNTPRGVADMDVSLDALDATLPSVQSASLVVAWFGDDLRCGQCKIQPKIEQSRFEGREQKWMVSGVDRATAQHVATQDGAPVYGATPADASVIEAINALKMRNKNVLYYPFILMDQLKGNALPDPWGAKNGQPHLPWRGRITGDRAPGLDQSPDQTHAADQQVQEFLGNAAPEDFEISQGAVVYHGDAEDWGYRRFILHQAALCAAAGGVYGFFIGSEMRALTQLRGANGFPFVEALITLAADVRSILGPACKISYAADWSEYFGYHPAHEPGSVYYHLDDLWADKNIDFIGIDNYMPISDWRDGTDHLDADFGAIYNPEYLEANIEGGEGYDWYYADENDRDLQIRTPITDGHNAPWVWRYKDIKNWWSNPHFNRENGAPAAAPTRWQPQSKPIWFTEFGCAAIDKGANQPNRFLDPKSSESGVPYYSNGQRDDYMQRAYLMAVLNHWNAEENNPISAIYNAPMIDTGNLYAWAWDARPYPWFPALSQLWDDARNYAHGHWLNGRSSAQRLAAVVRQICGQIGLDDVDVSRLYGMVRGYSISNITAARAAIEDLMLRFGFDVQVQDGKLAFVSKIPRAPIHIPNAQLVHSDELQGLVEYHRENTRERLDRVRLRYIAADSEAQMQLEEAVLPDATSKTAANFELAMQMTSAEARQTVARWLHEANLAQKHIRFALPNSFAQLSAGAKVQLEHDGGCYQITAIEHGPYMLIEAVKTAQTLPQTMPVIEQAPQMQRYQAPGPIRFEILDLPPLADGVENPAPRFAALAQPWAGAAALYGAPVGAEPQLLHLAHSAAKIGALARDLPAGQIGVFHRAAQMHIKLPVGSLQSTNWAGLLAGQNMAAIGNGGQAEWEIVQFLNAEKISDEIWQLTGLIRGQYGSGQYMQSVMPAGAKFVLLDAAVRPIDRFNLPLGQDSDIFVGPSGVDLDDPVFTHQQRYFTGAGARPMPPVHLRQNGPQLSWIRSVAPQQDRWDLPQLAMPEGGEYYHIRAGSGFDATYEAQSSTPSHELPHALYEKIAQNPDAWWEVAQVSAKYGSGAYARIRLNSIESL